MKSKRGLSAVIAVVLLIALGLVLVGIVFSFASNYISSQNYDMSEDWLTVNSKVFYSSENDAVYFSLEGTPDTPELSSISASTIPNNGLTYTIEASVIRNNDRRTYKLYGITEKPESIKLIPFTSSGDREIEGKSLIITEISEEDYNTSRDIYYYDIIPSMGDVPYGVN